MGTRTMGSQRKSDGLSKQGGVSNNLTLDEDLGKPLKSMNLYELLKNVATADDNQRGSESITANRQPSLSKKTVDELWQDIQHSVGSSNDVNGSHGGYKVDDRKSKREKEPTLGEMTLEDFLAKAGIDANSSPEKKNNNSGCDVGDESVVLPQQVKSQQTRWMQYQIPPFHQQQQQQQQQQHMFMSGQHQAQQPIVDMDFLEVKMKMCPTPLMGTLSDSQTLGRKRHASGDVIEKTVERRLKRMIKNRESAARSRARKQAYTDELENKVSLLKEKNERLKREREIDNALPFVPPSEPKYQLRRTSSM